MHRSRSDAHRRAAFTLIELMIVVAIIGILAAIAIPNFLRFQLKSKTSEGKANVAAIRVAEIAHFANTGRYVSASVSPATNGGTSTQAFAQTDPIGAGFDVLGWEPEGRVFFNYAVVASASGDGLFTIDASADLDGNGTNQVWGYVEPNSLGATLPGALGCTATWTGSALDGISVVGPCDGAFGQSEF